MLSRLKRAAGATALGLMLAGGALSPALAQGDAAAEAAPQSLELDRQVVIRAMTDMNAGGYTALKRHVGKLKATLAHAPEGAMSPEAAEVYGTAALMLTMDAVEGRKFKEALSYGARGLAIQPDSSLLLTETAAAYNQMGRFDEGLALIDAWLTNHSAAEPGDRARLHRARGFALIELKRLEEAEGAYQEALKLEPSHQGAKDELAYIAQLRAGGPQQGIGMTTVDKSATEGSKAAEPVDAPPPKE